METTIETKWKVIEAKDLKKGMFILVEWKEDENTKINYSLNKVIKSNKDGFTLQEMGRRHCEVSQDVFNQFPIFNSEEILQITKDGKYILPSREMLGIFEIDSATVKEIILEGVEEEVISKKEKDIIKIEEELELRKEELELLNKKKRKAEARIKSLGI